MPVTVLILLSAWIYFVLVIANHICTPKGYFRYDSKEASMLSILLHVIPLAFIFVLVYEFAIWWEGLEDTKDQSMWYEASKYVPPIQPGLRSNSYSVIDQDYNVVYYDYELRGWCDDIDDSVMVSFWSYPEPVSLQT